MSTNYNILCLDGGGIRGLLTALLLKNLPSNAISNATVLAGTSTGGIIATGLAAGVSIDDLAGIYSNQCSTIFDPNETPASTRDQIFDYLKMLTGSDVEAGVLWGLVETGVLPVTLFSAKWSNASLQQTMSSVLGANASTLVSALTRHLFVTTFQFGGSQWLPVSIDNLGLPSSNDSTLLDAAMSTSAAPTYFPPYYNQTLGYCIDGGTFANDPSTFVLSRALQAGAKRDKIRLLSIGTGATTNAVPDSYFDTVPPVMWGTYQYMFPVNAPPTVPSELLINLMMDASSEVDDEQSSAILEANYLRVEIPLPQPITLDDCSMVGTLESIAHDFMKKPEWTTFKDWVTNNFI